MAIESKWFKQRDAAVNRVKEMFASGERSIDAIVADLGSIGVSAKNAMKAIYRASLEVGFSFNNTAIVEVK